MPSLVTEALMEAIAQAESGNVPQAIGDTTLSNKAHGVFQVRLPAFQDVQRLYPDEFEGVGFEQVQRDPMLNRLVAKRYLQALESHYGITSQDRLISAYNAGPSAKRGALKNLDYVNKVKGRLGDTMPSKPQSRVDPIEQGIFRISRLTQVAGFTPLTVSDIERILAQVEPPRAMPGVQQPTSLRAMAFDPRSVVDQILQGNAPYPRAIDADRQTGNRIDVERTRVEQELNRRGMRTNELGYIESLGALV